MPTFYEQKKERTEWYHKYIKGWRLQTCTACNGSGIYDHDGSPECGACEGSGVERVKPNCFTDIAPLIHTVMECYASKGRLLRVFINSTREVTYQYYGSDHHLEQDRVYANIHFDYDPSIKMNDWCFTDKSGQTYYLNQFLPLTKKKVDHV